MCGLVHSPPPCAPSRRAVPWSTRAIALRRPNHAVTVFVGERFAGRARGDESGRRRRPSPLPFYRLSLGMLPESALVGPGTVRTARPFGSPTCWPRGARRNATLYSDKGALDPSSRRRPTAVPWLRHAGALPQRRGACVPRRRRSGSSRDRRPSRADRRHLNGGAGRPAVPRVQIVLTGSRNRSPQRSLDAWFACVPAFRSDTVRFSRRPQTTGGVLVPALCASTCAWQRAYSIPDGHEGRPSIRTEISTA